MFIETELNRGRVKPDRDSYLRLLARFNGKIRRDPTFSREERSKLITLTSQINAILKFGYKPNKEMTDLDMGIE